MAVVKCMKLAIKNVRFHAFLFCTYSFKINRIKPGGNFMRLDVEQAVHFYIMNKLKPNFSELGRQFETDPRTVKKYFESKISSSDKTIEILKRPSKLDPYRSIIKDKVELGCSATAIYNFIQKLGFDGKDRIVRYYCKEIRNDKLNKATIRVETTPGLSAQVDWKEDMHFVSKNGKQIKVNIFLYVLGYSRMKYLCLTFDRTQETFFNCMTEAFEATGGVPKEIWFDNQKNVVNRHESNFGKVVFNSTFAEYAKDAGFIPIACRPFRPQTKGKVEALARTMERLKVWNYEFDDEIELSEIVSDFQDELNFEISQAVSVSPASLLLKEKEYLHEFDFNLLTSYTDHTIARKVSKESLVVYQNIRYSVPVRYIGEIVQLTQNANDLQIYYNGVMIQSHPVSNRRYNYKPEDIKEILISDAFINADDNKISDLVDQNMRMFDELER